MQIDEISPGSRIQLEVKCNGKTVTFYSEIAFVLDYSVLIHTIKVNKKTIGFSEQCIINFLYLFEEKLYLWNNVKVKLVRCDGTIYHKIDLIGEGKPHNRRNSYRMYIGENMLVNVNSSNGPVAFYALIKDISETGVGLITTENIDLDRIIRLKINENSIIMELTGVVVRKEFLSHMNSYLYGCKFNEKNSLLGKYIAKKQGEQLRKKIGNYSSPTNAKIRG